MDERKRKILNAIIQDYIYTAEPVGSRTLVKRHSIGLSPATIRNEMSDLEEMGYLEQPHTSAGRIPSQRGYRYYVNSLLKYIEVGPADLSLLNSQFAGADMSSSGFPRQLAKLLSSLTSYISLIAEPSQTNQEIRHIDIIPLTLTTASIIVVLSDGTVNHSTVLLPQGVEPQQVQALTVFFNDRLQGMSLRQINSELLLALKNEFEGNLNLMDELFTVVKHMMTEHSQLVVDGTTNLLNEPEFKDINKFRSLLTSLEHDDQLLQILQPDAHDYGLEIKIGSEIGLESFNDCSLVVATFTKRDKGVLLGILGPTRMDYAKTIGFLRWMKKYFECGGGYSED